MEENQLIREKYPQEELFICDVADAVIKDIMPQMEHPFYSLSKKPETNVRKYEHNGNWIEIVPSVKGLATIYDKDILIYAISQIMAKLKKGEKVSPRVRITSRELLMFINRGTSGRDYMALQESLDRIDGTRIRTNIRVSDDESEWRSFGLVNSAATRRKNGLDGRLLWCEIELSDWVFDAIQDNAVLTLHRDYFRLRKPIERRIYEIARKHCGQQKQWTVGLETLHKKSGSQSTLRRFKFNVNEIAKNNHLPDYTIEINPDSDNVVFKNRQEWWGTYDDDDKPLPRIKSTKTYEAAKIIAPDGTDIYEVEQEWFNWWRRTGRKDLKNPDKAFLGFVSKKFLNDDDE